jgi:hypothetical protein
VILKSQVEATLVIMSASLSLQPGFAHIDNNEGRPSPAWLLPLTFSATVEGALLFVICSDLEGKHYIPCDEARLYIYLSIYIYIYIKLSQISKLLHVFFFSWAY